MQTAARRARMFDCGVGFTSPSAGEAHYGAGEAPPLCCVSGQGPRIADEISERRIRPGDGPPHVRYWAVVVAKPFLGLFEVAANDVHKRIE